MRQGLFGYFFVAIIVLIAIGWMAQAYVAKTMYDDCVESGKTKGQCFKMLNRELGGRGHNISIEQENDNE